MFQIKQGGTSCPMRRDAKSFRQRYEFVFVTGHYIEAARAPFFFCLFNAFFGRRHEIPPDITLGAEGRAAKKHEMCAFRPGSHDNIIARSKCQQTVRRKHLATNANIATQCINCAFFCGGWNMEPPTRQHFNIRIERFSVLDRSRSANPAFGEVLDKAGNSIPTTPFAITYALANVFLTLLGPLVVAFS